MNNKQHTASHRFQQLLQHNNDNLSVFIRYGWWNGQWIFTLHSNDKILSILWRGVNFTKSLRNIDQVSSWSNLPIIAEVFSSRNLTQYTFIGQKQLKRKPIYPRRFNLWIYLTYLTWKNILVICLRVITITNIVNHFSMSCLQGRGSA